ncbi:hypothetical protein B0F90DRAFT_1631800 [Multifurca ochricompacta]|uniref:PIH1 N-terminal domain-containing protein n=1 Tax=Multifurca ochricompacta TaxID=376703 RepID=A0AAD4QMN1_9AGAM|nr:hypothetical protein B0F90DRAFT_1631800 [Multifurca ochricompacta]
MTSTVTINVSPSPGFCIKSKLLRPGIFSATSNHESSQKSVSLPQGLKVFVNVAWSEDVPPPLEASLLKAIELTAHSSQMETKGGRDGPISVFASDGRLDTDKAGKPALVFDCIYHSSLKIHALKDANFKNFLVELALQHIEAQNTFSLSRSLGTPNISSKGPLGPRLVSIPTTLFPHDHNHRASLVKTSTKKLIEEVSKHHNSIASETPTWAWKQEGQEIHVIIQVPKVTRTNISSATLDLEPRRLTLLIPELYALDIDLNLSDTALGQALFRAGAGPQGTEHALMLKRARNLDVDGARAEWHVKERCLVIVV